MRTLISVATKHPTTYFTACCTLGLALRYWMAAGDIHKFLNPLFPLFS